MGIIGARQLRDPIPVHFISPGILKWHQHSPSHLCKCLHVLVPVHLPGADLRCMSCHSGADRSQGQGGLLSRLLSCERSLHDRNSQLCVPDKSFKRVLDLLAITQREVQRKGIQAQVGPGMKHIGNRWRCRLAFMGRLCHKGTFTCMHVCSVMLTCNYMLILALYSAWLEHPPTFNLLILIAGESAGAGLTLRQAAFCISTSQQAWQLQPQA